MVLEKILNPLNGDRQPETQEVRPDSPGPLSLQDLALFPNLMFQGAVMALFDISFSLVFDHLTI